jgi:hypothetical protein
MTEKKLLTEENCPAFPKVGTLESIVLAKLLDAGLDGVTYLDFADHPELSDPDNLAKVIENLKTGMYESDADDFTKFDS